MDDRRKDIVNVLASWKEFNLVWVMCDWVRGDHVKMETFVRKPP